MPSFFGCFCVLKHHTATYNQHSGFFFLQTIKILCCMKAWIVPRGPRLFLAIRTAELLQSLLFKLSPPPLSSLPLPWLILQANWPLGWLGVFTGSPRGTGWTGRGEGGPAAPLLWRPLAARLQVLVTVPRCAWSEPTVFASRRSKHSSVHVGRLELPDDARQQADALNCALMTALAH